MMPSRILCFTLAVLLTITVSFTSAHSSGAPVSTCDSMMPDHDGTPSQDSEPPFTISLSSTTVQAGETIEVTLSSESDTIYIGLLLKALPVDKDTGAAGSFIIHDEDKEVYQTLDCSDIPQTAITHCDSSEKKSVTITWTAPSYNGKFVFIATVMEEFSTFWLKVTSADNVEVVGGSTTVSTVPPPTTTPPNFDFDYSECGESRSCMGHPSNCISDEDCDVILTFRQTPDQDDFISFQLISNSGDYVAMGLSEDDKMGDDSVVECMATSPIPVIKASINEERESNVMEGDNEAYFSTVSISSNDGTLKCEFKRNLVTTVGGITTKLNETDYFILMAVGPLNGDGTDISKHTDAWVSSGAVDISSDDFIIVDGGGLPVEIILHGCFMVIAWVVCASVAVFLARFYKDMWPEKTHCAVKIWFAWHRGLNVVTVVATIVAIIVIFVYTGTDTAFATNAHPSMGIITTILMLLQPIGAVFRPMPGTPSRKIFNWLHFTGGMLACCCGVITINLAVTLKSSHLETYFVGIVCGYVAFYIIMFACMEYLIRKFTPKGKEEIEMKNNNNSDDKTVLEAVQKTKRKIHYKEVMLGIYCCGVVGFAVAMIAIIATS